MFLHKCKLYVISVKNYFTHVSNFEQCFNTNVNYMQLEQRIILHMYQSLSNVLTLM